MDMNNILELGGIGAILLKILPVLLIINAILAGLAVTLNKLKDYAILKDGKFFGIISSVASFLVKITDFLSANVKHTEKKAE